MNWLQQDPRTVQMHLCELRARATQARLARLAASSRNEPTLRHRAGTLLITAGRALMAPATEPVSVPAATTPPGCDL